MQPAIGQIVLVDAGRLQRDLVDRVVLAARQVLDGFMGEGVGRGADAGRDAVARFVQSLGDDRNLFGRFAGRSSWRTGRRCLLLRLCGRGRAQQDKGKGRKTGLRSVGRHGGRPAACRCVATHECAPSINQGDAVRHGGPCGRLQKSDLISDGWWCARLEQAERRGIRQLAPACRDHRARRRERRPEQKGQGAARRRRPSASQRRWRRHRPRRRIADRSKTGPSGSVRRIDARRHRGPARPGGPPDRTALPDVCARPKRRAVATERKTAIRPPPKPQLRTSQHPEPSPLV